MDTAAPLHPAKRVRWDDSVLLIDANRNEPLIATDVEGVSAGQPSAASSCGPSCDASSAISISSVSSASGIPSTKLPDKDSSGAVKGYRPDFTHQLFDEERIDGYQDGGLRIHILYTATSLDFLVKIVVGESEPARPADILSRLSKVLPPAGYTTDEDSFSQQIEAKRRDFKPSGVRVHEYTRGTKTFSVYRATGEDEGAREYHDKAQCLAPWFIEAADPIDLTDDRWEVFYLFEEESSREVLGEKWRPAAFAGYFTLFGFRNPVKGVSLRVCQALILPQFQRQGHGQTLLTILYSLARSRESVFEITVEDPAPGFEKVRNLVDARTLRDHKVFTGNLLDPNTFQRPSKDVIQAARQALKLTVSQIEIGFDILKARDAIAAPASPSKPSNKAVPNASSPATTTAISPGTTIASATQKCGTEQRNDDETRKRYRLMVKRRLLKRHGEELSAEVPVRKRQLEELYQDLEADFLSLGAKLGSETVTDKRL